MCRRGLNAGEEFTIVVELVLPIAIDARQPALDALIREIEPADIFTVGVKRGPRAK